MFSTIISAKTLREMISSNTALKILDASHTFYSAHTDFKQNFLKEHLPGSVFFDFSQLKPVDPLFQHRLPTNESFNAYLKLLGIDRSDRQIIVYDQFGSKSAARLWFTLKLCGLLHVAVLDGGLQSWKALEFKTESGEVSVDASANDCDFKLDSKKIKSYEFISAISEVLTTTRPQTLSRILDSRPPLRFLGAADEPSGIKPGNIPGSKNLSFSYLLNKDFTYKTKSEILEIIQKYSPDIDNDGSIIHTSGISVTACCSILALEIAGFTNNVLYDGGWVDWVYKFKVPEIPVSVKAMMEGEYEKHLKKKFK